MPEMAAEAHSHSCCMFFSLSFSLSVSFPLVYNVKQNDKWMHLNATTTTTKKTFYFAGASNSFRVVIVFYYCQGLQKTKKKYFLFLSQTTKQ